MQRRPYVPGTALTAAVLVTGLAGCSGETSARGTDDAKTGGYSSTANVRPGKFRTLPEPCGTVGGDSLRSLLPGLEDQDEATQKTVFEGQPAVTYDTDRRVGCRWKLTTPEGSRHLTLDFERIVSYDPQEGDDDRAAAAYAKKAAAAKIPLDTATPSPGQSDPGGTGTETPAPGASEPGGTGSASPRGDDEGGDGAGDRDGEEDGQEIVRGSGDAPDGDPRTDPERTADVASWRLAAAVDGGSDGGGEGGGGGAVRAGLARTHHAGDADPADTADAAGTAELRADRVREGAVAAPAADTEPTEKPAAGSDRDSTDSPTPPAEAPATPGAPGTGPTPGGGEDPGDGGESGDEQGDGQGDEGEEGDAGEDAVDLSPRQLDGIGDEAFLNDEFSTGDSGVHRDITIVFRSSNVIVTLEYDQWSTDPRHVPSSAELQDKAQNLARKLPGHFGD